MSERIVKANAQGVEILGYSARQAKKVLPEAMRMHREVVANQRLLNLHVVRTHVEELRQGDGNGWDAALDEVLGLIDKELK